MRPISKGTFFVATVLVSVVSSCGGSSGSSSTTAVVADVVVTAESGTRLDQSLYSATAGPISIAYVNSDSIHHTLVIAQDGTKIAGFELHVSQKNDVDQGTINLEPGNYTLLCTVPGHQNMKADFTVT